jgi:hypothetical protein
MNWTKNLDDAFVSEDRYWGVYKRVAKEGKMTKVYWRLVAMNPYRELGLYKSFKEATGAVK